MVRRKLQQSMLLSLALVLSCTYAVEVPEERAARSLAFHEMSMSMSFSMPHGSFKMASKAIKGSKGVKGASKGSKGCPPPPPPPKILKERRGHHHNVTILPMIRGKGKLPKAPKHNLECEEVAVPHVPTPSVPTARVPSIASPTSMEPNEPAPSSSIGTNAPSSASEPSETGPIAATPYQLSYTLELDRIPIDTDYTGVTDVTDNFVKEQMAQYFQNGSSVQFLYSNTTRDSFSFVGPNEPVNITFTTEVTVDPSSDTRPTVDELDALLEEAFSASGELDTYLANLAALPPSNIFQTTTAVEFKAMPQSAAMFSNPFASMSSAAIGGIAAAGAGILIVLAGGIVAFRRGGSDNGEGHDVVKFVDAGGDMTVAGDTYAGSSYAGTSMDAESVQHSGWGNHSHFRTPSYRTSSPTVALNRSESDSAGEDSPPASPRQMQTVDL
ncbi:hypothetical protein MPSEU_000257800 [Mayamaea pseudoterrestris]|nr:hypothetical protein MPSEU_000257800 [Mayamaea pseudoterrestris]